MAIAEQHSVTFAAGLAAGGMRPVVCVYSTFLQRAYDQIVHDVALPDLPVVIAVDHAGIVGPDGPTHQGVFDISFLLPIPNMVIMAPGLIGDFRPMLDAALSWGRPVAVRYPKGPGMSPAPRLRRFLRPGKHWAFPLTRQCLSSVISRKLSVLTRRPQFLSLRTA